LLQDVRNVVKEMRNQDQLDLKSTLEALIQQLPNCHLTMTNSQPDRQISIHSLALRNQLILCLQEGISNALRHGQANDFVLDFQKNNHLINIDLSDNGIGCDKIIFGNGLHGMQERLENFKGTVKLIPQPTGCTLKIQVEDNYD